MKRNLLLFGLIKRGIITIFLFLCLTIQAQNNFLKSFSPLSPNAASLGKFIETPVSLYTGIPEINIPLYEIEVNGFKVPISLSYHAGGIRVDDVASSVGLGWALNAGGMINRKQNGICDEDMVDGYNTHSVDVQKITDPSTPVGEKYAIASNWWGGSDHRNSYDIEPDIFSYSFLSKAGKFFYDPQGNVNMQPVNNRFKVLHEGHFSITGNYNYMWARWIITDNNGVQYIFGRRKDGTKDNLEETCITGYGVGCEPTVNSWNLNQIILTNGNIIDFLYDEISYSLVSPTVSTNYVPNDCQATGSGSSATVQYLKTQKIKEIIFPNGKVIFVPGSSRNDLPQDNSLDRIEVYQSKLNNGITTYLLIKTIKLQYDDNSPRLMLNKIFEIDPNSEAESKKYTFSYNYLHLPPRLSNSQDLWGFYNGQSANSYLSPMLINTVLGNNMGNIVQGANRAVDPNYTQADMLKTITYPTGGTATFVYENNIARCDDAINNISLCSVLNYTPRFPVVNKTIGFQADNLGQAMGTTVYGNDFTIPSLSYIGTSSPILFTGHLLPYASQSCGQYSNNIGQHFDCVEVGLQRKNSNNTYTDVIQDLWFNYTYQGVLSGGTYRISIKWLSNVNGRFYVDSKCVVEDIPAQLNLNKGEFFVGGLRIKQITNFEPVANTTIVKKYNYNFNVDDSPWLDGVSSGIPMNMPVYKYKDFICGDRTNASGTFCEPITITSQAQTNILAADGACVGYKKITVTDADNNAGKSEYYFTTAQDYPDQGILESVAYPFPKSRTFEWRRGLEISKTDYRFLGGTTFEPALSTTSGYTFLPLSNSNYKEITATKIFSMPLVDVDHSQTIPQYNCTVTGGFAQYKIGTESFFKSNTTQSFYENNSNILYPSLKQTQLLEQDDQSLEITQNIRQTSNGDDITEASKFSVNYIVTGSNLVGDAIGIRNLIDNNYKTVPIEKLVLKNENGIRYVTEGAITTFYPDKPLPAKIFRLELLTPIPENNFTNSYINENGEFIKDSHYKEAALFNTYDLSHNLLEQQKPDDVQEVYLWGYQGQYPVAKIVGSNYEIVRGFVDQSILDNPANDQQIRSELNRIRTGLNNTKALITTYTYAPLIGITSETDSNGKTISYEYDSFNRLKLIHDQDGNILKKFDYQYHQ